MKEPIKAEDIRKGDLIRVEDGDDAREYRAPENGFTTWMTHMRHYLLERPQPDVVVPAAALQKLEDALEKWRRSAPYGGLATDVAGFLAETHQETA